MNKVLLSFLMFVFTLSFNVSAQNTNEDLELDDLFNMSFEDLMNLEVRVGNISGTSNMKLPLSVTTITAEQIELSNAQNILHLIQIYVPGASYWRHDEGPMIGLRGITSDRNNKLLMVVNGIVVNQRAHNGIVTELENWDMEDIEKIEVIRGPGSVTYGPGAIAGVINIVTKSAGELKGFKASAQYVTEYNNKTVTASYGFKKDKVKGYFHASVAKTEGFTPDVMVMNNDTIGYRGVAGSPFEAPAHTYMKDFNDEPQMKFLASLNFLDDFTFTARYNKAATTVGNSYVPQSKPILGFSSDGKDTIFGNYEDRSYQSSQQLMVSLKNNHKFEGLNLDLESEVAFLGSDYMRTRASALDVNQERFNTASIHFDANSFDNPLNLLQNFSENSIIAKTMGVYKLSDAHKIAFGAEYIHTNYGIGWGDDARTFRMGDNQNIINGSDSYSFGLDKYPNPFIKTDGTEGIDYFFVGDGWSTNDIGVVAEANLGFSKYFNVLLSGRLDKNSYSNWVASPRIAFISELTSNNVVKLVLQQSNKISTAEQLYIANRANKDSDVESITNAEFIYTGLIGESSLLNTSIFYNKQDAIGWSWSQSATAPVADLDIAGFEVDYQLKLNDINAGINHTYTKLLKYKLKEGEINSTLSYAEYTPRYPAKKNEQGELISTGTNIGSGKDLIGISNNVTKLYLDKFFTNRKYAFHTELALFWGFEGNKDVKEIAVDFEQFKTINYYTQNNLNLIGDPNPEKQEALYKEAFDEHNFFGTSIFWNATFTAKLFKGASLQLGVHNILGNDYARIDEQAKSFDIQWSTSSHINAASYFTEPRSYSAKLTYQF